MLTHVHTPLLFGPVSSDRCVVSNPWGVLRACVCCCHCLACAGVVDDTGVALKPGLRLSSVVSVPALSIPPSQVDVAVDSGNGAVKPNISMQWTSSISPVRFVNLTGVTLTVSEAAGMVSGGEYEGLVCALLWCCFCPDSHSHLAGASRSAVPAPLRRRRCVEAMQSCSCFLVSACAVWCGHLAWCAAGVIVCFLAAVLERCWYTGGYPRRSADERRRQQKQHRQ